MQKDLKELLKSFVDTNCCIAVVKQNVKPFQLKIFHQTSISLNASEAFEDIYDDLLM